MNMGTPSAATQEHANSAYPWDSFDPAQYVLDNYATLIEDDRQILQMVRDFFITHAPNHGAHGVDVGAGANLYPMMAMLPFCDSVTLFERSRSNLAWLGDQLPDFGPIWDPFWAVLAAKEDSPYGLINPRVAAGRVRVQPGDLFKLERGRWDLGTMFFVAESMSEEMGEFDEALQKFVHALRPGAPFAAAFMAQSPGYTVGGIRYPAVSVTVDDVRQSLKPLVEEVTVEPVFSGEVIKPKYKGMILALGRAGATID
ncbi:SCO2525 family SAM-dependent methyltransferase [Dactylosporangium sp. AC04546]|uniref:SCO2525 family SAM-dependent methyltransferase n=1 Tax=Dactylosporangium sp. AC04546 TaxID=2862460 RepID=UPI001EDFEB01|nr:SCO2525 family SAM-dependent methyltransferase [Dactylosporangium sp. AC04546]WVK84029.1 SCO2525 family SAM-dependent methyltransferase [Dactylosporangium sp. AC04546]